MLELPVMKTRILSITKKGPWFSHFGEGIYFNIHLHWIDDITHPEIDIIQTYTGKGPSGLGLAKT